MLKTIKTILLVSIAVFVSFSCKKKDTPAPNPAAEEIVLSAPIVSGDSVRLTWTKLQNDSLEGYTIMRVRDSLHGSPYSSFGVDRNSVNLTDYLSLVPYVQYYITASLTSGRTITSNKVVAARTGLSFIPTPAKGVIFDKATNILYIPDQFGNIYQYDVVNKKIINQVAVMPSTTIGQYLGECCIDTFNGKRELYVPRSDGWLFIYDAATLTQIDQINVGGGFLYSVVSNNGFLFISADVGGWALSVYKRATKSVVSHGSNSYSSLKIFPHSNTKIITYDFNGVVLNNFNSSGIFTSFKQASVPVGPAGWPIGVYPDGSKVIYSTSGTIYNDTFGYVSSLPLSNMDYTSFDFDTTNQLIYASNSNNTVQSYSMTDYHLVKSVNTKGAPQQVFYVNNSVICLSNNTNDPYFAHQTNTYATYFLEQL